LEYGVGVWKCVEDDDAFSPGARVARAECPRSASCGNKAGRAENPRNLSSFLLIFVSGREKGIIAGINGCIFVDVELCDGVYNMCRTPNSCT